MGKLISTSIPADFPSLGGKLVMIIILNLNNNLSQAYKENEDHEPFNLGYI